ncbi:MAG: hypothetical protein IJ551_04225 [Prevotella sp.]|nr:hypothetical protein [Prevotella sp.]
MMKKLLSLMTLVLGVTLGAQAQTLIDYPTSSEGTSVSGTSTVGTVKIHANTDGVACLSLANGYTTDNLYNGNSIILKTEGGFKAGDVLTIAGVINNKDATKRGTAVFFTLDADKKATVVKKFEDFINSYTATEDPAEQTYTLEADVDSIMLGRDGGTKTNLTLIKVVRGGGSSEEAKPAITFEGSAVERSFTVGVAAGKKVSVDWGDGNLVEKEATTDYDLGWDENGLEFTGTPAGTVKIYGDGIIAFDAAGKFNEEKTDIPNALTAINVSNAPELVNLYLNANKLTAIDLSKNTKLVKLNIANNQIAAIDLTDQTDITTLTANDNQLTVLDLSKNAKLTTVVLSNNKIATLDFSNNPVIKTFTCLNNQLTSVTIGANTAKGHTFQFGGNKLTKFSLKDAKDLATSFVYLRDNELTELELPSTVRRIWVDGNNFTLAQLYALKSLASQTFTYATLFTKENAQAPLEITSEGGKVDLSEQAKLGETATVFTWKDAEGNALAEGTDYTAENGVFTFLKALTGIHCEMTNAEFPLFTAEKPYKTTAIDVVASGINDIKAEGTKAMIFNLAGQRIDAPQKGINIIGGKKVVLK